MPKCYYPPAKKHYFKNGGLTNFRTTVCIVFLHKNDPFKTLNSPKFQLKIKQTRKGHFVPDQ